MVLTTLDSGRVLLLDENLSCARTISSYFASVFTGVLRHHVHDLEAAGFELAQQFRHRFRGRCWKSCIRMMPLPFFVSLVITDLITWSGLCILKSKESMSVEKVAMLRVPR